ncbi:MAG: anhydro-N-acetylmuramic acid kinase [Planctomycetota bacterium]|nr:MAG: anhydro-N-acetylmuramic acid kinase [Planctomycetota bacterium]
MARLLALRERPVRTIVGLMTGTSVDGVDAALVRVEGAGPGCGVELLAFRTYDYEPPVRARIHSAFEGTSRALCELNFLLGEALAEAALAIIEDAGLTPAEVDLVGSSGQTVHHVPRGEGGRGGATLQLGEASVIAERTGLPVVCDFRTRDVAAGGEGAPLVPYVDYLLFSEPGRVRCLQNIGGMANVTVVPERREDVIAFDTGPGNVLIDHVARALADDPDAIDEGGRMSALGAVDEPLLRELLAHPYLAAPPPKSTGRETFGAALAERLIARHDERRLIDLLATVVRFTADSIADAYERYILPRYAVDEVVVSGGGVHNATLMRRLAERLAPLPVRTLEDLGLSSDAKEAVAFAILANETIAGHAANLPAATGAARPVVLGKIVP